MKSARYAIAAVTAAGLLAVSGPAQAANPTKADFDACNREAQARITSPSASPSGAGGTSGAPSASSPGSSSSSSTPGASGSASTGAGSGGSTSGASGGMSSSSPGTTSGTSGGSGATASGADAQLQGMAAAGQSDQAYQQAYRDCMKRLGF
jgi:hypothetical protein